MISLAEMITDKMTGLSYFLISSSSVYRDNPLVTCRRVCLYSGAKFRNASILSVCSVSPSTARHKLVVTSFPTFLVINSL